MTARGLAHCWPERAGRAVGEMPYAAYLGVSTEVVQTDAGIRLRLPFAQRLVGNTILSAFHGGVIASFMQVAAFAATIGKVGESCMPRLVDFSVDYLSTAGPYDLFVQCEFQRLGRRIASVAMRCWQADQAVPVAAARAHLHIASRT